MMTREEYKRRAAKHVTQELIDHITFPVLLREVAIALFLETDIQDTELVNETKRRFDQLERLGWTDEI